MRLTDIIKALYKEPGKALTQKYVLNTLVALQRTVGGYIEVVPLRPDLVMIVNEEGKLRQMEENFRIRLGGWVDEIVGPALFVGVDGDEFTDCPLEESDLIEFMESIWGGGMTNAVEQRSRRAGQAEDPSERV